MAARKRRVRHLPGRSKLPRTRTPDGPKHAYDAAVAVLGPYPWTRPEQLELPNWVMGLPEVITEDVIQKWVRIIGSNYQRRLETDAASIRVKDALTAYQEIAELADLLADCLAELSIDERYLLTLFAAPEQGNASWHEHIFNRLPSVFMQSGERKLPDGAGVEWLRYLAEHTRAAMHSLAARGKLAPEKLGDVGGRSNLSRLRRTSPGRDLVKMCWQLFEWAPHCQPSGTAQGPLHEFMGYVHEWATGENVIGTSKFESHLKAFAKPWQRRRKAEVEYLRFKQSLPEDQQRYLESAISGYRPDLRKCLNKDVLDQAEKLRKEIAAVKV